MAQKSIIESSESFPSPSGKYSAAVSSQVSPAGEMSQAMVSGAGGGSGLVALYSARVSMGFEWRGDEELVVRYPEELPAPRLDDTNSSFGFGGKGRVVYQAVPAAEIRPLRWSVSSELTLLSEEKLARGHLSTFEDESGVFHTYSYYDVDEPDSCSEALQARGLQGGGETWAGIVHGLVLAREPALLQRLEFDPEGDGLRVHSTSLMALRAVAEWVGEARQDDTVLELALDKARGAGQLE